jgi:hypothetical protein
MATSPCRGADAFVYVHWSYVAANVPWQRAPGWQPPAEPDRIAALEQRVRALETLFWSHSHPATPTPQP